MQRSSRSSVLASSVLASSFLALSFAALLAFVPGTAFGQLAKPATKPLALDPGGAVALADGVLVDVERQVAYVMAPERGIDAVGLSGGASLWTADAAAKPLAVVGDVLVAQAEGSEEGRLNVVSFDVRDGRPGAFSARLDLPEGVSARLSDGPRRAFRVQAGLAEGKLVLSWRATKVGGGELQGYLPGPEEGMSPNAKSFDRLEGAAELDLASGAVRRVDKAVLAPRALDVLPPGQAKGLSGRLFTSADGRHVLASVRTAERGLWQSYRWTIVERATGRRLGTFDHYTSSAPFMVAGGRLLFVEEPYFRRQGDDVVAVPRQVRAVDLASGAEVWTKEVSDPSYRGEFPP